MMKIRYVLLWILFSGLVNTAQCAEHFDIDVDKTLGRIGELLRNNPNDAVPLLDLLKHREDSMSEKQRDRFYLMQASSLAFRGKYQEKVNLMSSNFGKIRDVNVKARFLYHLADGYAGLGNYEQAIANLNEAVVLLPELTLTNAKVGTLQGAITLFRSLKLFDDAAVYADRLYTLEVHDNEIAKCLGLGNKIAVLFDLKNIDEATRLMPEMTRLCREADYGIMIQIVNMLLVSSQIESGQIDIGLKNGISLIKTGIPINEAMDDYVQLYDSMARAFLAKKDFRQAEHYGTQAFSMAESKKYLQWMTRTTETIALIKQAQGEPDQAIAYFAKALQLKDRLFDEQLQKNLAYQRVRFDVKDKENLLERLEQKNRELKLQQKLEREEKQNLLLIVGIIAGALLTLGIWLYRTIREKNRFQRDAQVDGLTQIINRTHFLRKADYLCQKRGDDFSIVLFDMDNFKSVNDSFGHPAGDWVLRKVSQIVSGLLRDGDIFGRFGGEEFAICLPSTGVNGALQFAERCRIAIAEIDSGDSGFNFPVTASFGIASMGHSGIMVFDQLIEAADKALYKSKMEGRNCVSTFAF